MDLALPVTTGAGNNVPGPKRPWNPERLDPKCKGTRRGPLAGEAAGRGVKHRRMVVAVLLDRTAAV